MGAGALVNNTGGSVAIGTSYTVFALAKDANYQASVGGYVDHVEFTGVGATSPTKITCYLCYDAAGDDPMTQPTDVSLPVSASAGTKQIGVLSVDKYAAWAAKSRAPGVLYVAAKTDAGTYTLTDKVGCVVVTRDFRGAP